MSIDDWSAHPAALYPDEVDGPSGDESHLRPAESTRHDRGEADEAGKAASTAASAGR